MEKIINETVGSLEDARQLRLIVSKIADLSVKLLGAERCTVFLYDAETNELFSYVAHQTNEIRVPSTTGVAGYSFTNRFTTNIEDASRDYRYNPENDKKYGYVCKTILTEPIVYDDKTIGVLQLINKREGKFSNDDITLVKQLTQMAAPILSKSMSYEKSLQIKEEDMDSLKSIISDKDLEIIGAVKGAIVPLYISDNIDNADVFFDYNNLNIEIYNFSGDYYVISRNNDNAIIIGNTPVVAGKYYKIDFGSELRINNYIISRQQLRHYIKIKMNPYRKKEVYLFHAGNDIVFTDKQNSKICLKIILDKSKIHLQIIDDKCKLEVNDEKIEKDIFVNLNDDIFVNSKLVNIRRIVYEQLLEKQTYYLDPDREYFTISNRSSSDISFNFDLSKKWEILLTRQDNSFVVDATLCPFSVFVNSKRIKKQLLSDDDKIYIMNKVLSIDNVNNRVEVFNYNFRSIELKNIKTIFRDGSIGLDDINLKFDYGEFIAIMGPSGCGKSTLLNLLAGIVKPSSGSILIDKYDLNEYYHFFSDHIAHVPQDDLLFENLTVYENLYYNACLRYPGTAKKNIELLVERVLKDVRLTHKKNDKAGSVLNKTLSGGERKRLNIGLELLSNSEIFLLDEPTSGLSSKDSEVIIDILHKLSASGKIVITVIHQPGSRTFQKFDSVILLDRGGKLAYYGDVNSALQYFKSHKEKSDNVPVYATRAVDPDILLEVLEETRVDKDGSLTDKRLYTPEYWQKRYQEYLREYGFIKFPVRSLKFIPEERKLPLSEKSSQFITLLKRNFINKLRNKSNIMTTFLEAPLLALLISLLLRFSPEGDYNLYNNRYLTTFFFLSVIVSSFLALSNSIDEIIKDGALVLRERMLNIKSYSYYNSKFFSLMFFAMLQNYLYLQTSYLILDIRELFITHFITLTMVSMTGVSAGLFVSGLPGLSLKTVQNMLPIILIPQIIFGGHIVKFQDMTDYFRIEKNREIPEICDFMPSRWGFEAMVNSHYSNSKYHSAYNLLKNELDETVDKLDNNPNDKTLVRKRDELLSDLNMFRKRYKKDFGNMIIEEEISDALHKHEDKISNHEVMFYPVKTIPKTSIEIKTENYNRIVLFFISLIISSAGIVVLSFTERISDKLLRIRKKITGSIK
ncbi:MAG: ATP-binding cassette domain-containing protein [Candidatus Delongbacteria bacterium]|nr:ATP-binding cassette domain-containing protein [Candidatus Delongbacteria bacterium]MBN2835281.1 ATP-binding cassette domain-containing protein [Candidatus Delongbacteria bacterium]